MEKGSKYVELCIQGIIIAINYQMLAQIFDRIFWQKSASIKKTNNLCQLMLTMHINYRAFSCCKRTPTLDNASVFQVYLSLNGHLRPLWHFRAKKAKIGKIRHLWHFA